MKYKQMLNIGLAASNESHDSMIPPLPMDGEYTDATLGDVGDVEQSMEDLSTGMEVLNGVARKLSTIRDSMQKGGTLSKVSVEAYATAVDNLVNPLGLSGLLVSAEGFEHDNAASLKYSAEGIKETLMTIIDRLIELILAAVEKGKEYVAKMFGATEPLANRLDALIAKANSLSTVGASKPNVDISAAQMEWLVSTKGTKDVSMAAKWYQSYLVAATFGKPEQVARYIRSITSVVKGWTTNSAAALDENAFASVEKLPTSTGLNPSTGYDELFIYTPFQMHVSSDPLPVVEFVHRDAAEEMPEQSPVAVMQAMMIDAMATGIRGTLKTFNENRDRYDEVQTALAEYGQVVEQLKGIEFEQDEQASRFREVLMMVNASVRSHGDFPVRMAAKMLHGLSAMEAIMSKMINDGYGKKETDVGATGTGATIPGVA